MQDAWKVIVNPNAGIKKAQKDWPKIQKVLESNNIKFDFEFSNEMGHAILLSEFAIQNGYRKIIVVGGDGTLNEVVNGIMLQKEINTADITVGMITVGTGNDWAKTYSISSDYENAVDTILNGKTFLQDVGFVEYQNHQDVKKRYFANIAGLGFDARVVEKVNEQKNKGKGGSISYLKNLISNLMSYKSKPFKLIVDGQTIEEELFSIGIGVCKYNGNGMMQLPEAIPDDGLLDITIIKKISKLDVVKSINKLYDGTILEHPKVIGLKGKEITFESSRQVHLEADGETLGVSPCKFGIIPKCLKVMVNHDFYTEKKLD